MARAVWAREGAFKTRGRSQDEWLQERCGRGRMHSKREAGRRMNGYKECGRGRIHSKREAVDVEVTTRTRPGWCRESSLWLVAGPGVVSRRYNRVVLKCFFQCFFVLHTTRKGSGFFSRERRTERKVKEKVSFYFK